MAEREQDEVGRTVDGLVEGVSNKGAARTAMAGEGSETKGTARDAESSAESKGSIGSASSGSDLTQASGGAVD